LCHPKWTWTRRRGCAGFLANEPSEDLEALDEALDKPTAEDPAKAELVKLRFFAGLTMPEESFKGDEGFRARLSR
jgi:ECF sigma factor